MCCSPWGCKESDMIERLKQTELETKVHSGFYLSIQLNKHCKTIFDTKLFCKFNKNLENLIREGYVCAGGRKVVQNEYFSVTWIQ